MRKLGYIFLLICFQKAFSQSVKIKYYNKTGYDLDSLKLSNSNITALKNDSSTSYIQYPYLLFQDGHPYDDAPGIIPSLGKKLCVSCMCGTGVMPIREGTFEYDITLVKNVDFYILRLHPHEK